jgi:predicted ABC-type ATPase
MPDMFIVAGPPGSGKSTISPLSRFNVDWFNADDRAAEICGSYQSISLATRQQVNAEMEQFVEAHIRAAKSFAIETTLRSDVTFQQAIAAQDRGFTTHMIYVALKDFQLNIDRVRGRAWAGGHSASTGLLLSICEASMKNLPRAIQDINTVAVFDNTDSPMHVLDAVDGKVHYVADKAPEWLVRALWGTEHELSRVRSDLEMAPVR